MSVYNIFILLIFNRECMECNVVISFRILSSFKCFLCYFQTEWSVYLRVSMNCSLVSNNASLVSAWVGGRGWSSKCGQAWRGGGGSQSTQICVDILYEWLHRAYFNRCDCFSFPAWLATRSIILQPVSHKYSSVQDASGHFV